MIATTPSSARSTRRRRPRPPLQKTTRVDGVGGRRRITGCWFSALWTALTPGDVPAAAFLRLLCASASLLSHRPPSLDSSNLSNRSPSNSWHPFSPRSSARRAVAARRGRRPPARRLKRGRERPLKCWVQAAKRPRAARLAPSSCGRRSTWLSSFSEEQLKRRRGDSALLHACRRDRSEYYRGAGRVALLPRFDRAAGMGRGDGVKPSRCDGVGRWRRGRRPADGVSFPI